MKAAYYQANGSANEVIKFGELPKPEPKAGEVLVRIIASGVNPSDGYLRAGAFGPLAFDLVIPGQDGAGIIEAVGLNVERKIGERVWIYNGQWKRPFGTAAQYIALPEHLVVPLPESISFEQGAALGVAARTAHFALNTGESIQGKTVFISGGAGTTSFAAIQLAKYLGASVITSVSSPEKAAIAGKANPDYIINYKEQDVVKEVLEITGGQGVAHIVEVNLGANLELDSQILGNEGIISAYGSTADFTPKLPVLPLMFKQGTIRTMASFEVSPAKNALAIHDITAALQAGVLSPHIWITYSLEETAQAHEAQDANLPIGKIVLLI